MESTATIALDRSTQLKAFDETKTGVKGLVEAGISEIPAIFHAPPSTMTTPKPPSSSQFTIPTIDLQGGSTDSISRRSLVEKIGDAAERWGFFQVINHGIPLNVMDRMKEGVREFHELDPEVRKGFYSRDPSSSNMLYMSNFDLYNSPAANWRDTLVCFTAPDPPRPDDLPATCGDVMLEYTKQVVSLGEFLFELLSEALGLNPNHLKEIDCPKGLRMLCHYYPPCPEPDLTLGASKHSGSSFLTVLLSNQIEGLQVLSEGYWFDVPPAPGALIINLGDLLQASSCSTINAFAQKLPVGSKFSLCMHLITNDKFISSEHRVLANRAKGARVSVASFFTTGIRPNPRTYGPIRELVSEDNPPKYRDHS